MTTPSPSPMTASSPIDNIVIDTLTNNTFPLTTSTSKVKTRNAGKHSVSRPVLSTNSYHSMNPSADLRLPAEIFASDDSVSDAGLPANEDISTALQDFVGESVTENDLINTKDKMVGGINIKLETPESPKHRKSRKGKEVTLNLSDIKTELQDDLDWNNMALATVNTNNNVSRFQSRYVLVFHIGT